MSSKVMSNFLLGRRPTGVGQRPTTDLLNSEFGCSEENESCSGGYPELIYAFGHGGIGPKAQWWAEGPLLIF